MDITLSIFAFIFSIIGVVGCIVPILPGVVFNFIALVIAYYCSYTQLTLNTLMIWLVVTIAVSIADYFLPIYMTKKFGGSRAGVIGATVGLIGGLIFFGVFGVILGPFIGAVLGELINDKKDSAKAFKVGIGSFLAFFVGTGLKLIASIWMFQIIWMDTYPVVKEWFCTLFA